MKQKITVFEFMALLLTISLFLSLIYSLLFTKIKADIIIEEVVGIFISFVGLYVSRIYRSLSELDKTLGVLLTMFSQIIQQNTTVINNYDKAVSIKELEIKLDEAVKLENYELAKAIREMIQQIKNQHNNGEEIH